MRVTARLLMFVLSGPALLALAACNAGKEIAAGPEALAIQTEGRLVLDVESAATAADGQQCVLAVTVRNNTGKEAVNVQSAWMATTEGFGIISDYQMLGDFGVGESRPVRLAVHGAPCNALRALELTRAVCTVGPPADPPQSCAERVVLDARRVVPAR